MAVDQLARGKGDTVISEWDETAGQALSVVIVECKHDGAGTGMKQTTLAGYGAFHVDVEKITATKSIYVRLHADRPPAPASAK